MSENAAKNVPVNEVDIAITPELVAEYGLKPTLSRHARPCAGHPGRHAPVHVALDCRDKRGNDVMGRAPIATVKRPSAAWGVAA